MDNGQNSDLQNGDDPVASVQRDSKLDSKVRNRSIFTRLLIIPFGRYRRHSAVDGISKPVFVGREGQTAYLIDALTSNAKRGAYLITGRRGVGKSTFVEKCVEHSNDLKFRRYMRRNPGRTLIDQACALLLLFVILALLTGDSELQNEFSQNASPIIKGIGIAVLFIPFIVVFTYTIFCLTSALKSIGYNEIQDYAVGLLCVLCFGYGFVLLHPLDLILVLFVCFFILFAIGNPLGNYLVINRYHYLVTKWKRLQCSIQIVVFIVALSSFYYLSLVLILNSWPGESETIENEKITLTIVTLLQTVFYIFQLIWLYRTIGNGEKYRLLSKEIDKKWYLLASSILNSLALYLFFRLTGVGGPTNLHSYAFILLNATVFSTLLYRIAEIRFNYFVRVEKMQSSVSKHKDEKTVYYSIATKKLTYPATESIQTQQGNVIKYRPVEALIFLKVVLLIVICIQIANPFFVGESATNKLANFKEDMSWVLAAGCAIIICFLAEFVWITRGLSRLRLPHPLSATPFKKGVETHHNDPAWADIFAPNVKGKSEERKSRRIEKYSQLCSGDFKGDGRIKSAIKIIAERLFAFLISRNNKIDNGFRFNDKLFGGTENIIERSESVNIIRLLNSATFSSLLVKYWTPSIVVRINLGFDSLDHRSVIHAMLHGLRDSYKKKFISRHSVYALFAAFCRWSIILIVLGKLSAAFFSYPNISKKDMVRVELDRYVGEYEKTPTCDTLIIAERLGLVNSNSTYSMLFGACMFNPVLANSVLPLLYIPILDLHDGNESTDRKEINSKNSSSNNQSGDTKDSSGNKKTYVIIDKLLHYHYSLPRKKENTITQYGSYSVRVFHILLLLVLYWISGPIFRRLSLFPYKKNLRKIESLADSLVSTESRTNIRGRWSLGRIISSFTSVESEQAQTRSPLDSRSVELAFMTLLNDISESEVMKTHRLFSFHAPSPDIIFIFDELDKISALPTPENDRMLIHNELVENEVKRSAALHELLSDMKRLIGAAPARFIFVGNRSLHDEYVADESKREPLLSTIFDADIYLPSLLLDRSQLGMVYPDEDKNQDYGMRKYVKSYLMDIHKYAVKYNKVQHDRWSKLSHLIGVSTIAENYDDSTTGADKAKLSVIEWNYQTAEQLQSNPLIRHADNLLKIHKHITDSYLDEFVGFLAFRSKGIPKKLGDLIAGFVRPSQRIHDKEGHRQKHESLRRDELDDDLDLLYFSHGSIYRVQLINSLFKQLEESFESQLLDRDDKVTIDVLYLFDFLMKFHGRAFSWSNLEHVDELVHIHKTPDLRQTIAEVLDTGVGRFLHPVLNGLFSFRFRTEFAAEIKYLSKISEEEMAAFNFTLEESQSLKSAYSKLIASTQQPNEDLMVALGELHEYDQDYEQARGWYYSALFLNDREFAQYVGEEVDVLDKLRVHVESLLAKEDSSTTNTSLQLAAGIMSPPDRVPFVKAILQNNDEAQRDLMLHLPWANRRIRLMLQIGLTYEQTYDLERAQSYYFSAHRLARSITSQISKGLRDGNTKMDTTWFAMACDHLAVLYQPAFAAAWISEKSVGSIDGSVDIVELELFELANRLPIDKRSGSSAVSIENLPNTKQLLANFLMIGAETHNKAGDLYFFKGYSAKNKKDNQSRHVPNLNLRLAVWHYSKALHLVGEYLRKYSIVFDFKSRITTGLPTFISQVIYSNVVDISESTFACASIEKTLQDLCTTDDDMLLTRYPSDIENLLSVCSCELACFLAKNDQLKLNEHMAEDEITRFMHSLNFRESFDYGTKEQSVARINSNTNFSGGCNVFNRALLYSLLGAEIAEKTGLKRAAIDEYVTSLEMVDRILKWLAILIVKTDGIEHRINSKQISEYLIFILRITLYATSKANQLHGRHAERQIRKDSVKSSMADDRNLADAATQVCGILLTASTLWNAFGDTAPDATGDSEMTFDLILMDIRKKITKWFDVDNKPQSAKQSYPQDEEMENAEKDLLSSYDFEAKVMEGDQDIYGNVVFTTDSFARSRLIYLNDRYCFPFLAGLQRLKMLCDDTFLRALFMQKGLISRINNQDGIRQIQEANRWTTDLLEGAKRFDNTAVHTPLELAETCYLSELVKEYANKSEKVAHYSLSFQLAVKGYQTITMGNAYYVGLRKMIYLFDDFNDRKVHFKHSSQMAGRDIISLICNDSE